MTSNIVLMLPAPHDCYLPAMPLLSGEVYRYNNESDIVPSQQYWDYVGATENPPQRIYDWNTATSDYAGPKIANARKTIPPEYWKRYSFPVFDTDPERLKRRLKEYETFYIAFFDSYEHGYNGNRGGKGIAAWALFRVTDTSGAQKIVESYEAASKLSGVPIGSLRHYTKKKGGHLTKNGVKIERIN